MASAYLNRDQMWENVVAPNARSAPRLAIVVDTEEEFDWSAPFGRANRATRSIAAQPLAHRLYDRFGIVPTYVIDYPVATNPEAIGLLAGLQEEGGAEIGAHLHGWVNPPDEEDVTTPNSYQCNLPPELERAKIERLTDAIEAGAGRRPTIFKAGRYGFGAHTAAILADLGYRVDCSFVPHASFAADGGPVYHRVPDRPFWLDRQRGLLEVPLTSGFIGAAPRLGRAMPQLFDSATAQRLHVPGLLSRTGLVARSRLTPEGVSAAEQCRLLRQLAGEGTSMFTLTYHSPSLSPGCTPYVRTQADLAAFLATIEQVLTYFRDELGGEFTTLNRYRDEVAAT